MSKIGKKIGKLTVVEETDERYIKGNCREKLWKCKCDCGGERLIRTSQITSESVTSCGCKSSGPERKLDLIGQKFGKLKVISFSHIDKWRSSYYNCECECGNKITLNNQRLKSGKTTSCRSCTYNDHEELTGGYWGSLQRGAESRKITFDITQEYAYNMFLSQDGKCRLTGQEISLGRTCKDRTASLDRISSKKGYIVGNVQWVHKDYNRLKNNYSNKEFIKMCKTVAEYNR